MDEPVLLNTKYVLALMCLWLIFYSAGEYLSKLWVKSPSWWFTLVIVGVYGLGVLSWLPALAVHGQLAALSTVVSTLAIVSAVLLGVFVFGEHLEARQLAGIILAVIACFLTY